ncbi:hypothetical protein [Pelobacter propionicus]|uniref:Uncharacterized protein n=1 Tax=Pelobacter propionicus (strain DSM 2379 / NBRC 103807 / OttBd1) TaxID=338966 RepID=A1ARA0_PELPD|nr:hypothetical protein [Pelobacter propionicus]ABK99870.1 hypothetical protein Ppro_2263 [Pelobacter propionicus DSM 2379]
MKKRFMLFCAAALSVPMSALAGVNVNVNLGIPAPVVVAAPPAVVFASPPLFLVPPSLGIYVGVGIPYDIVYVDDFYYLNYRNAWYRSNHYNGPWAGVRQERLPLVVRRQGVEYIRVRRDREYQGYRRDHDHYRGRYFRPDQGGRPVFVDTRRRDWKEERKQDRREMKFEHKQEQREMKFDHKQEQRAMKDLQKRENREMKNDRRQDRDHGRHR